MHAAHRQVANPFPPPQAASAEPAASAAARGRAFAAPAHDDRRESGPVSFALPAEWNDVTTFTATGPAGDQGRASVLRMAREPMRAGDTLRMHADRLVMKLAQQVTGLDVLESGPVEVAGRPGIVLRLRLATEAGTLEQHIVMLDPGDEAERRVATFNVSGPKEHGDGMREVLANVLRTVRFRAKRAESRAPAPSGLFPLPRATARAGDSVANLGPSFPMPGFRVAR